MDTSVNELHYGEEEDMVVTKEGRKPARKVLLYGIIGLAIIGIGLLVIEYTSGNKMDKYAAYCDGLFGVNNSNVSCEGKECSCKPVDCTKSTGKIGVQDCLRIINEVAK